MIEIHPDQRCECPKARGSGRFYLGREVCRLCSGFIILTAAEMRELRQAELRASVRQRGVWPAGTAPVLAARDVRRIVGEMLQADPDITNEAMRDRISFYGTYPQSDFSFFKQCTTMRKLLNIPAQQFRRPGGTNRKSA